MHHRSLYPALATLAIALVPSTARADDPRRVGIVVATAVNVSQEEADGFAEDLGAALHAELAVDVIAGRETRRRQPDGGLPEECVASAACRQDLGQRLDAAELLMLVIVRIGDSVQIDATWANVASGKVTSRPAIKLPPGSDRSTVFAEAAPTLLPHIERTSQPNKTDVTVIVPSTPQQGDGRHMTKASWIATGVSGAALIGGTVFALSARSKYDSLDADECRDMPCSKSRVDALSNHALAADVLFGVSIASGVTALVLYIRSGGSAAEQPTETPSVTFGAGPGDVGFAVGGTF